MSTGWNSASREPSKVFAEDTCSKQNLTSAKKCSYCPTSRISMRATFGSRK